MKINLHLLSLLCLSLLFSCSSEQLTEDSVDQNYFRVSEFNDSQTNLNRSSQYIEYCYSVDLMAGQHIDVGALGVSKSATDLILTYTTISGWTLDATHVSIGDCNEQWVPLTRSGNPKIGRFEHTEPHSAEINRVVYHISLDALPTGSDLYCFAAHAEVSGPNGEETAWAGDDDDNGGGITMGRNIAAYNPGYTVKDFRGRSWATYIEALLSACDY